jgi:hypothetical protein
MVNTIKIFISHTTRDKRDHKLALNLANGLRTRGAEVWIAPKSIPTGSKWKERIISGIMEKCSHFLVILSASSVEAEWVLREIELAQKRFAHESSFKILPLEVSTLKRYCGKKFIEQFQQLPYHEDFSTQLDAIATELALSATVPDQFRNFVESRTTDFVGRDYVLEAVDEFLSIEKKGYFIVEGDPGEGKSAILAQYVKQTGCVAHFNIRAEGITRPGHFLNSVCSQLIARYGLSEAPATGDRGDEGGHLMRLLEDASTQLKKGDSLIIAVDALDEVDQTGQTNGANILYLPSVLPEGVFVSRQKK